MRTFLLITICTLSLGSLLAQDIEYVREQAEALAHTDMKGRGYVQGGLARAAEYISQEFQEFGLKSFDEDYYQAFRHPVNTFPGKVELKVFTHPKVAGLDFLVHPSSPSDSSRYFVKLLEGAYMAQWPRPADLADRCEDCILVLDMTGVDDPKARKAARMKLEMYNTRLPVIWMSDEELVWAVSDHQRDKVLIEMKPTIIQEGAPVDVIVESEWIQEFESQNVLAYIPGTVYPDSFLVFTAHYDHLGMMGEDATFYGANDNASGTAYILSLAKHFSENPSPYSVAIIAFAGEEAGLVGSRHFVEQPEIPLDQIRFVMNLDLMGSGVDGIMMVNAVEQNEALRLMREINEREGYLPKVGQRKQAANSDHYFFSEAGVPAVFIYALGGSDAYHDIDDVADNLTFEEYEDIFRMLIEFVERY